MKFLTFRRLIPFVLVASGAFGATKHKQRLEDAATVLEEVMSTPDKAIPQNLLDKAHSAVIIPGLKKGAFIFGSRGTAKDTSPAGMLAGRAGARLPRFVSRAAVSACSWALRRPT